MGIYDQTLLDHPEWEYLMTGAPPPPAEPGADQEPADEQDGPAPLPRRTPKRLAPDAGEAA